MYSGVERILEGKFNTDNHSLSFSVPMLELEIAEDSVYEGSFIVYGPQDKYIEAQISVTGIRMKCLTTSFTGNNSEISFEFDAQGLKEGDLLRGEFQVISNQGEYFLPYEIKIDAKNINTDLGNIKNLFHFTNLAKTKWSEAVKLFSSKQFRDVLGGADKQYINVYQALVSGENKDQCMEEFLLYVKKKQPSEYIIEQPNVRIENSIEDYLRYIDINKNGWGYTNLKVSTNCDFIQLEKDVITNEDFIDNEYSLPYSIKNNCLHDGRNFGTIILEDAYNNIRINVCVNDSSVIRRLTENSKLKKHYIVDIMKYYEAFRLRKIGTSTWMANTSELIDKLMELSPESLDYELMHIHMLITGERYNEASWRLEQIEKEGKHKKDKNLYCYFYYLTTLINRTPEHTNYVIGLVRDIYDENPSEWRIGWLLIYLSEKLTKSMPDRWNMLLKQFKNGANSPAIYVEASQILISNPTIMTSLGEFEIQVLKYMARNEILNLDIIDQFIYLLGLNKNHNSSLFMLLTKCYEVANTDEVLKAIVSLLINTDRTDATAFIWYEKAVNHTLRITKLYEYYMLSLDLEASVEIPKVVLMYFAFDSNLDPLRNAYLYSYIYQRRDEMADIYSNYKEAIERFVSFQLLKGVNNKYLTYLYRNMVSEKMISKDVAKGLMKALFTCVVKPARKNINLIYVYYDFLEEEYTYKLDANNEAYIPLFGNDVKIVLEDINLNRYAREEEYEVVKLMVPDKLANYLVPLVEDVLFDLWVCNRGYDLNKVSDDNLLNMQRLCTHPNINRALKRKIRYELINYYNDKDMMEELDELLTSLDIVDVKHGIIPQIIQLFTQRGMYNKAYEWIVETTGENIDAKTIVRIISRILKDKEYTNDIIEDTVMTAFVYKAFQSGKYDETLLKYLIKYIHCTSKEMRDIWRVAKDYGLNVTEIEGRLLNQQLYTNAYVSGIAPIFISYSKKRLDNDLCLAYLSQISYDYFVNERVLDSVYIDELQSYIDEDANIPLVCKLAYTRYYAKDADTLSEKINRSIVVFLKEILIKGMYFPYFKEYAKSITYMHRFIDKTMIEYRAMEGSKASIHFMIEKQNDTKNEYITEDMKEMFCGIFVKQFVLFFGERIQYYIVESDGENEQLTESGTLSANEMEDRENISRYTMINDIAISRTLGDYGTMDRLLSEYFQNEYLLDEMFAIAK